MTNSDSKSIFVASEEALQAFAIQLLPCMQTGMIIFLKGELGAGKTTLVRALLRGLGWQDAVKSPSFSLLEMYEIQGLSVLHFDLYRLSSEAAFRSYGFEEYFSGEYCCLIEWPERAESILPTPDIVLELTVLEEGRLLTCKAGTERGKRLFF